ncbi:MAG: hypothetical protein AB7O32_00100 [Vicinamibacterales bacterium]
MRRLLALCAAACLLIAAGLIIPDPAAALPPDPPPPPPTPTAPAPAPAAPPSKTGVAVPVFLCGASADLERHGLNRVVLEQGWSAAVDQVFVPRLLEYYGPPRSAPATDKTARAPPPAPSTASRRVIFHLPFGRSPVAGGDMPFDGLVLLQEHAARKDVPPELRAQLLRAADGADFVRAMARLVARTGCAPEFYLGTVDAGNQAQWSAYSPSDWGKRTEASAGVFRRLQTAAAGALGGTPITVYIDAGGVRDEASNSWEMCLTVRRMGLRPGVEPWPAVTAGQWARDTKIPVMITSQLFEHLGTWSVPREHVEGRVTILFTGGALTPGSESETKVLRWMREGYDVAVGIFRVERTAEEWAAAVLDTSGGGGGGGPPAPATSTRLEDVIKTTTTAQ